MDAHSCIWLTLLLSHYFFIINVFLEHPIVEAISKGTFYNVDTRTHFVSSVLYVCITVCRHDTSYYIYHLNMVQK